jgi:nitrite reductase (NADH) large subunit
MPSPAFFTAIDQSSSPPRGVVAGPLRRSTRDTLVVIGNGMAGHRLCRELVRLGARRRYHIVVFGEEPVPAYDRVHLTDVFSGRHVDDLLLAPRSWYGDHNIDLRLGDPVVEIDRSRRTVQSASGVVITYTGTLVLATGSSPYVPPIVGARLANVFVYRTLGDAYAIRERTGTARTAAVIGGGLLGLEAARALQQMGLELVIVEAAAAVMPMQLDQAAGKELERHIVALGIRVETAAITKRIEADGTRRRLVFADGSAVTVDMVVIAAGVRPRTDLAVRCGLACSPTGGIVVDDQLRTSDPHIRAIGECASHGDQIWGLVAPSYAMADVLAMSLTGSSSSFATAAPPTRLKLLGVDVATAGEPLERGTVLQFRSSGVYRRVRFERGRLTGALGVGEWPEFSRVQDAVARQARIWPWQMRRFERSGELWRDRSVLAASRWPAQAVVCNCLSVTRGQLAEACAGGSSSVDAVVARTGASTLCGSCRPLIAEIVGAGHPPVTPNWRLLAASVAAILAVAVIVFSVPVPFSDSVQHSPQVDILWRDNALRQWTGFSLLGLSLMAASLTLRKRWASITRGSFSAWRTVHAVIGVLTLVTLAIHTGLRLGDNANLALMASFGMLNIAGAAAGGATALERAYAPLLGSRCRQVLVTTHLLAIWPLPLLIVMHVVSVYYF